MGAVSVRGICIQASLGPLLAQLRDMRTLAENAVLLVISGLLATTILACGGGSGSDHANHTHGGVPTLVSSSPLNSQSHVSRDATLVVEFTTELIPESIAGAVELVDASGLTLPGQAGLIAPHVVGFYPFAELPAAELLTLRVLPGLLSQTRETIPTPIEIRFRTVSAVRAGSLLINEVYAGAAPGDQAFVELVNVTSETLNLEGVLLETKAAPRAHVFGRVLLPSGAAVVIGASRPEEIRPSGGLPFLDSVLASERILLKVAGVASIEIVDEVDFSLSRVASLLNRGESVTRETDAQTGDLRGGQHVLHSRALGAVGSRSPGTRVNGIPFPTPLP